jgi:hypothetical protein
MNRVHRGVETRPFSEIVKNIEKEPAAWQGMYSFQLDQFLSVFNREQLLVLSFDDLHESSPKTVSRIFEYLGVDSEFPVNNIEKTHNSSSGHRRPSSMGMRTLNLYQRHVEQKRIPFIIKKQFINVSKIGSAKQDKPSLSDSEYKTLLEFYRHDTANLSNKFGIDTSDWL